MPTDEEVFEIPCFTDAHVHLRQGDMMRRVAPYTGKYCDSVVVMPNTVPPIHSPDQLIAYRAMCEEACQHPVDVRVTAKLLPRTTPDDVKRVGEVKGFVGWKLYPAGVTTNSDDGISHDTIRTLPPEFTEVLREIDRQGQVLLVHGETDGFVLERESEFVPFWCVIKHRFPTLRMTLEHISTAKGVRAVVWGAKMYPGTVLGTITLHHLLLTLNDVVGNGIRPDNYCKPIVKTPDDLIMLRRAAFGELGEMFALGSDSAPHLPHAKYAPCGCAGVFSAPVLGPALVRLFQSQDGWREKLDRFTRQNANRFYNLTSSGRTFKLRTLPKLVPKECGGVVPFLADTLLPLRDED